MSHSGAQRGPEPRYSEDGDVNAEGLFGGGVAPIRLSGPFDPGILSNSKGGRTSCSSDNASS
jgi:hypothetical protein